MYTVGKFKRLYGFNGECNFVEKCGSIQTIHTPESLLEKMIDIAKPGIDDKILVMFNVEFVIALKNMGCKNITYFSDSERMTNLVEKMYINNIGNSEVEVVYMENFKKEFRNLSKILENMKFDLIISNPPYNQNLDLKILKEVYEFGDKICFVHPAGWLYYQKPTHPLYYKIRELLGNNLSYIETFETHEYFNAWTFVPSAITMINKHSNNSIDVNGFDIHGNSTIYKSLKGKILKYCKINNVEKYKVIVNNMEWEVGIPGMAPGGRTVFIQKSNENIQVGAKTKYPKRIVFTSESEAINFKDYLKTKIARFCLSIYKINQQLDRGELASVPYMPTYTRPWTDEEVAAEIGLTDEELKWAINWIPDYYPEDKEKYTKRI